MDYDYAVIGAGAIGLAVAAELATHGDVVVLEKKGKFGQGTSSRNSEVVHAGIYYRPNSLKSMLCAAGRKMIEGLAAEGKFAYSRIGKYIVAVDDREQHLLANLKANAETCGAIDLRWADADEVREQEPDVRAAAALFSPHTGVLDSHGMMNYFRMEALDAGADFVYDTKVTAITQVSAVTRVEGYEIRVADGTTLTSRCVVNSAGLYSDRVAEMAGLNVRVLGLDLKWSRGVYYGIEGEDGLRVKHLVYPVPDKAHASLGVHVCVDLAGGIRFGPTAEYLPEKIEDYAPPHSGIEAVAAALSRYLPKVKAENLYPVMVGIRPKLSGPGEPVRDFYIQEERERGLPGFVNLIGIESPGLTAAPAIGKFVASLITNEMISSA